MDLITKILTRKTVLNTWILYLEIFSIEWLIVDEADKLCEEGTKGFKDQLKEISQACTNINIHRCMFSATNTPAVTVWCRNNLKKFSTITVGHR